MLLLELLVAAVIIYALQKKGDVTFNGKAGFFSFFFQAKDRPLEERRHRSRELR
jgi:hypothetical protein